MVIVYLIESHKSAHEALLLHYYGILCVAVAQVEDWKSKNQILRNLLRQHGIVGSSSTDPQWEAWCQRVFEDNHIWAKRVLEMLWDTLFVVKSAWNRGKQLNIVIDIQIQLLRLMTPLNIIFKAIYKIEIICLVNTT